MKGGAAGGGYAQVLPMEYQSAFYRRFSRGYFRTQYDHGITGYYIYQNRNTCEGLKRLVETGIGCKMTVVSVTLFPVWVAV